MSFDGKNVIDEKNLNQMILNYEHVIKIILSKYRIGVKDYEDAFQEGRIGILKAIRSFKEGKGSNLTSFVSLCIERQILSFLRNDNRKKNKIHKYSYSIDTENSDYELYKSINEKNEIENYIINRLFYEEVYQFAIMKVSEIEQQVYTSYITGYSIAEISEKYAIPKKQIYIIIAKVRKKIDEILSHC